MRRLLILSTTFFPDPSVGGVRVSQWARHLPEFGWEPLVLCRHYGYDATPEDLAEKVHPDVRVEYLGPRVKKPGPRSEPGRLYSGPRGAARRLLERLAVPDVDLLRWKVLASDAVARASEFRPDVVLSTSPPVSIHWLGKRIARGVGAKWVADFRDPYTIDPRFKPRGLLSPLFLLHRRYERATYRDADLTVHAIPLHGRWARRAYGAGRQEVRVLENGTPELVQPNGAGSSTETGPIRLRAVGYLAPEAPALLHEAMTSLRCEGVDFGFVHAGTVPPTVSGLPEASGERMTFLGRVPHAEAMGLVAEADVLLAYLSEARSRYLGISSKLYEYLGVGKPILVVNPTRADRHLVRRVPWCESLVDPGAVDLADSLQKLADPSAKPSAEAWAPVAEKYDRRRQTEQLAGWLDQLIQ